MPVLAGLCCVYAALAAFAATAGSSVVLATAGGSPDWLLGPLRVLGVPGADGAAGGPLFYAGLWVALVLYAVVLAGSGALSRRAALTVIGGLHALFLIAPPILSQDVFSYIAYARLGVEHDLNPYGHSPLDAPSDAAFPYAGSKDAVSVYGPAFTLLTYPLAHVGVPTALWALKAVAALASFAVVLAVGAMADRTRRVPPVPAMVAVGLNPLTLVHVVGGGHNEALMVLVVMLGVLAFVSGRPLAGTAVAAAAAGIKASAALVVPFLAAGAGGEAADGDARRRAALRAVLAAAAVAAATGVLALGAFGSDALDGLGLLSSNQDRTSSWSFPHRVAQLLALAGPGGTSDYTDAVRLVFAVAFGAVLVLLLRATWRGRLDPIAGAGWATLALLVASAWLVPWYALWLLPFAALTADRRLLIAAVALCAWMLPIAVPL